MKTHEEHRFCLDNPGPTRHRGPKRLVLVVLLFLSLGLFSSARGDLISGCPIVAHRGFSYIAPENSMAAIEEAIKVGAHGCEFDVYKCASGQIVLMHDSTVDRTTNGTGSVIDQGWSYLQTLTIDYVPPNPTAYGTQRIPVLYSALTTLKNSGTAAICEIKQDGIAADVVARVEEREMVAQTVIISFKHAEIAAVEAANPSIVTALLLSTSTVQSGGTSITQMADTIESYLDTYDADVADVQYGALSRELMTELNQRGVPVWAYTVDSQATMQTLLDWGVKSITTNRPDLGMEIVPEPGLFAMLAGLALGWWAVARRRVPWGTPCAGYFPTSMR